MEDWHQYFQNSVGSVFNHDCMVFSLYENKNLSEYVIRIVF